MDSTVDSDFDYIIQATNKNLIKALGRAPRELPKLKKLFNDQLNLNMKHTVTLNGKPLSHYSDDDIAHALAKETERELTEEEEKTADGATD